MAQAHVWTGRVLQPAALAVLEGLATISVSSVGERNDWYTEASTADAIIVAGETFVTNEVMDRIGPRLRIIARTGIGVDRIDLDAATRHGILVVNTPDGPTESTAEHTIALLLNLCKQVMISDRILRAGQPYPALKELTPGLEVAGAVLGLVGLGRIGSRVAAIARILGMKVIAFDPFITPVDEAALLEALRSGHLAGAALDVFDPEPAVTNHPLFTLPNTICTPHIGSYTSASVLRIQVMACEEIASALRGERPTHLVNAEVWGLLPHPFPDFVERDGSNQTTDR